jgi:hypothetical protein
VLAVLFLRDSSSWNWFWSYWACGCVCCFGNLNRRYPAPDWDLSYQLSSALNFQKHELITISSIEKCVTSEIQYQNCSFSYPRLWVYLGSYPFFIGVVRPHPVHSFFWFWIPNEYLSQFFLIFETVHHFQLNIYFLIFSPLVIVSILIDLVQNYRISSLYFFVHTSISILTLGSFLTVNHVYLDLFLLQIFPSLPTLLHHLILC